jgi:hypothetical protein
MAKAILKFDLDNPDDQMAFKRATKATDMAIALFEITHNMQRQVESMYGTDCTAEDWDLVDKIFDLIHEKIEGQNINIDELIN